MILSDLELDYDAWQWKKRMEALFQKLEEIKKSGTDSVKIAEMQNAMQEMLKAMTFVLSDMNSKRHFVSDVNESLDALEKAVKELYNKVNEINRNLYLLDSEVRRASLDAFFAERYAFEASMKKP